MWGSRGVYWGLCGGAELVAAKLRRGLGKPAQCDRPWRRTRPRRPWNCRTAQMKRGRLQDADDASESLSAVDADLKAKRVRYYRDAIEA